MAKKLRKFKVRSGKLFHGHEPKPDMEPRHVESARVVEKPEGFYVYAYDVMGNKIPSSEKGTGDFFSGKKDKCDTYAEQIQENGIPILQAKCYRRGQVVESTQDLAKRWPTRFVEYHGPEAAGTTLEPQDVAVTQSNPLDFPDFEAMTVEGLRAYAEAEEIDLGDARLKAEIIAKLEAAIGANA